MLTVVRSGVMMVGNFISFNVEIQFHSGVGYDAEFHTGDMPDILLLFRD